MSGRPTGRGWLAKALGMPGELTCGFRLYVRYRGHTILASKADNGYGQGGNGTTSDSHYAIDLYYSLARALHFDGKGDIQIALEPSAKAIATAVRYYNPLEAADVTPERIDQGVDYAAHDGYLVAIADGTVNRSVVSGSGWPGAYLSYTITVPGPLYNRTIYYAEGVIPLVHSGEHVHGGQRIANLIRNSPHGIELGYAAGPHTFESWAMVHGGWTHEDDLHNLPTRAGIAFSRLIQSLGGPPGIEEGRPIGRTPPHTNATLQVHRHRGAVPRQLNISTVNRVAGAGVIVNEDDWSGLVTATFNELAKGFNVWWHRAKTLTARVNRATIVKARR